MGDLWCVTQLFSFPHKEKTTVTHNQSYNFVFMYFILCHPQLQLK